MLHHTLCRYHITFQRHKTKGSHPRRTQEAKDADHVKDQLADLPLWDPSFIYGITITQLVLLCIGLTYSIAINQFAKWGIKTTARRVCKLALETTLRTRALLGSEVFGSLRRVCYFEKQPFAHARCSPASTHHPLDGNASCLRSNVC